MDEYLKEILTARVYDVAHETPLTAMTRLGRKLGNSVSVKREDLQPIFSFKIRGAYNRIANLSHAEQNAGVIASSAGNHAQGVALAAQYLGIQATIVMPCTTPSLKVDSVRELGAKVILFGDSFDQANAKAHEFKEESGATFVHPYDDPLVIAGQGTVAKEIIDQYRERLDAIFVPVGGGGLAAGITAYIKSIRPEIKVIGVEAEDSACLSAALAAGKIVTLDRVGIFADGVSVARIGEEPFRIIEDRIDEVITVTTDEICGAIKEIFDGTRAVTEPAGALAVAGLIKYSRGLQGKNLLAILSGANMNFDRLRHVSERAELGDAREGIFAVEVSERVGSFRKLCQQLGKHSVTEFNYRYGNPDTAIVFIGLEFGGKEGEREAFVGRLKSAGYTITDLSHNELAKLHIRHMVGGPSSQLPPEIALTFEFPQRPGALAEFLEDISDRWSFSLFHYRNHGAAFGRVFMAFQAEPRQRPELFAFFDRLGYPYTDETENPAYRHFLLEQER